MKFQFEGRGDRWTATAEVGERSEEDRHQPYAVRATADGAEVTGVMLVTDLALSGAAETAGEAAGTGDSGNRTADDVLAGAFRRALIAELGLRPLTDGFRFVVDHRWVEGG